MKKQFHLTQEGVNELETELAELKGMRADIADKIKTAREFGDLAENAEYQTARQDQEKNESRIAELEHILQSVEVIAKPKVGDRVQLGSTVTLTSGKTTKTFHIVGTVEADPIEGKISDESPIGQAVIGKKVGEEVVIKTPAEAISYKISKIS